VDSFIFSDPYALAAAFAAMAVIGLSKGGLAGMGIMAVPILSLVISPVQAAGILLPILLISDAMSLYTWWGSWDRRTLMLMLPGALVGILIGWATAAFVSDSVVRLIVGFIAIAFVLRWFFSNKIKRATARPHSLPAASFWGTISGYTSFVAHSGGPPYQVYTMPLNMAPRILTGTGVLFFAIVNALKLIPYFALGQFDTENLTTAALLTPIALIFTLAGAAIIRRMSAETFYPIIYAMTFLVGLKMLWDGFFGLA